MSGNNLRTNFPTMPVVRRQLDATRQVIYVEVRDLINRLVDKALLRVKALTPVDTGKTRDKWRIFAINRRGPAGKAQGAFFVAIDHPYNRTGATRTDTDDFGVRKTVKVNDGQRSLLSDLEFGTRAHTIYPKMGKFLRFKIGAKTVYTKKDVKHPGTRAYHMTTIAAAEAQAGANAGLDAILRKAIATVEAIR